MAAPFRRLSDANAFAAGILDLGGRRVGIVRIASFDDDDYQRTCRDEWSRLRLTLETTCERECRDRFRLAVRDRLLLEFESRIRQFRRAGVDLVVLDLTRNPGGYGWYEPIGTILAGRELPVPPSAFARDHATVAELDDYLARLDRSLALCPLDRARRRAVERSYRRYDAARAEALASCDRAGVWTEPPLPPAGGEGRVRGCSQLTSPIPDDRHTLASLSLRSSLDHRFRDDLLEPAVYRAPRVSWGGPLAVLVDRDTASAAEILAGTLQDWAGAAVIGEHTSGCGGGWHRGDRPAWLMYSDLELHVPDEVEYRRDGSNYRAGIEPDILTGWGPGPEPGGEDEVAGGGAEAGEAAFDGSIESLPVFLSEIISYPELVAREKANLQKGMNFGIRPGYSIILMSVRRGAPYHDRIDLERNLLIYEGHDVPRSRSADPKKVDQPMANPGGSPTENGKFYRAAKDSTLGYRKPERVKVYEKIQRGVWSDKGFFHLVDAEIVERSGRKVFDFFLKPVEERSVLSDRDIPATRLIPTEVKVAVWKRDHGKCVLCSSQNESSLRSRSPVLEGREQRHRRERAVALCQVQPSKVRQD